MPWLIVNADDFGLSGGTNRAILDAHRAGSVTSASLLANGAAFDDAIGLARENPTLGVGVHLTLTEGPPVSAALYLGGPLPLSNRPFVRALLAGRLPREAIRREFAAQVERVIAAGIRPTHLDGHKYIHLLPGITAIAADVARRYAIPAMRVPHRVADLPTRAGRLPGLLLLTLMGALAYRLTRRAGLWVPDRLLGFVGTGHLDRRRIRRLLRTPRPGVTELLCHPAYRTPQLEALGYHWIGAYAFEGETAALCDPALRRDLEAAGWTLCHYGTLPHADQQSGLPRSERQ